MLIWSYSIFDVKNSWNLSKHSRCTLYTVRLRIMCVIIKIYAYSLENNMHKQEMHVILKGKTRSSVCTPKDKIISWKVVTKELSTGAHIKAVLLPEMLVEKPNISFQHDRTSSYVENEVTTFMNRQIPKRNFGLGGTNSRFLLPSALNPLAFLPWGLVKM